uniref:Transglutaminase-like domain-containing protein n=1 Tax=Branchiostoma floridae TaxID=7739 RepID=C3YLF5_BRAFL|eukprot:XP_002602880.1 hypothetical protein BRAFLDRAFT_103263 [Branchiostoma floridae]
MAERPRGFAFDTGRRIRRPYANFPMIIESPWWPPLPPVGPVEPPIVPPPPVGPVEPPPIVTPPPKPTDRPLTLGNFIFHVNENGPAHHAEEFLENNVVRRGQPFSMGLLFDRKVDLEKDKLLIEFQYGINPLPSKGTLLRLPVGDALKEGEWSAAVVKADGQNVKVSITSPANAIVGRYHVVVETELAGERSRSRKVDIRNVVVLFNPWCKDDLTYLDDNTKLEEYVLNEYGCQFFGNYYRIGKRGWNFGQVNSADENGVLEGNWSGDYSWGTPPTGWNGSVGILRQWGTERRPVRYGQCWVFSGVLTTGTDQERAAVRAAVEHGSTPWTYESIITHEDVEFSISADEEVYVGQDVNVTVTIKNTGSESRHVTAHLTAYATYYTGVLGAELGELEQDVTIAAGGEDSVKMTFTPREYLDKLVEQAMVKVFVLAHVDTTKQVWAGQDDIRLLSPDLVITAPSEMTVGQQSVVRVEFTNPLDVKLTQAVFRIEGPGLQRPKAIYYGTIMPGKQATVTEFMTPMRAGKKTIVASLTSNKLQQVTGEKDVDVKRA